MDTVAYMQPPKRLSSKMAVSKVKPRITSCLKWRRQVNSNAHQYNRLALK